MSSDKPIRDRLEGIEHRLPLYEEVVPKEHRQLIRDLKWLIAQMKLRGQFLPIKVKSDVTKK